MHQNEATQQCVFEFKAEKVQPASREHNLKSPAARVILPWCRNMPVSAASESSLCLVASPVPFFSCLQETGRKPSLFQCDHPNAFTFVQVRDGGGGNIPAIEYKLKREILTASVILLSPYYYLSLSLLPDLLPGKTSGFHPSYRGCPQIWGSQH